ncbi:hypothetical protein K8I61_02320 [bacterium]|nr:hypothetical protein [bacterium]
MRATKSDFRFAERIMYTQGADLSAYVPDADPWILYRMKPGGRFTFAGRPVFNPLLGPGAPPDRVEGAYSIHVNALGARGPERTPHPDAFRIVCLGGSNTHGAEVNDDQAWPARLAESLEGRTAVPVEVFNFGMSGYVGTQTARLGEELDASLSPDLFLYSITNIGPRAVLGGDDIETRFARDPWLWWDLAINTVLVPFPSILPESWRRRAVEKSALYRQFLYAMYPKNTLVAPGNDGAEIRNAEDSRRFLAAHRGRAAVIVPPIAWEGDYRQYWQGVDVPILIMNAKGMDPEFREMHPPSRVYRWYGKVIADWLIERRLVPLAGGNELESPAPRPDATPSGAKQE